MLLLPSAGVDIFYYSGWCTFLSVGLVNALSRVKWSNVDSGHRFTVDNNKIILKRGSSHADLHRDIITYRAFV